MLPSGDSTSTDFTALGYDSFPGLSADLGTLQFWAGSTRTCSGELGTLRLSARTR
jgi:hypothetical protein